MRRIAVVGVLALLVCSAGCLTAVGFQVDSGAQEAGDHGPDPGPDPDLEPVDGNLTVHYLDVGQADATFAGRRTRRC